MELRFPILESEIVYRLPREAGAPDSFFPREGMFAGNQRR